MGFGICLGAWCRISLRQNRAFSRELASRRASRRAARRRTRRRPRRPRTGAAASSFGPPPPPPRAGAGREQLALGNRAFMDLQHARAGRVLAAQPDPPRAGPWRGLRGDVLALRRGVLDAGREHGARSLGSLLASGGDKGAKMMKIAKILNFAPEGQRAERSFGSAAGERSLLPLKAKKGPKDFFCFPAEGRRGRRPPGAEGPRSELSQTSKSLTSLASCLKSLASRLKSLASLTSLTSKIGTGLLWM